MKHLGSFLLILAILCSVFTTVSAQDDSSYYALTMLDGKNAVSTISDGLFAYADILPFTSPNGETLYMRQKTGFMDVFGNTVIPSKYASASAFSDGLADAYDESGYIYISADGNTVLHDSSWSGISPFVSGHAVVYQNLRDENNVLDQRFGITDQAGNTLWLDGIIADPSINENAIIVKRKGESLYGFCDIQGNMIIEPQWERVMPFSEGLAPVRQDGLWGFIDQTGSVVIPCQYEQVQRFSEGYTFVYDGYRWTCINKKNEFCFIPFFGVGYEEYIGQYEDDVEMLFKLAEWDRVIHNDLSITPFSSGLAIVDANIHGGMSCLIDTKGQTLLTPYDCLDYRGQFTWKKIIDIFDNVIVVENAEGKQALANIHGELLTDFFWDEIKDCIDSVVIGNVGNSLLIVYLQHKAVEAVDHAIALGQYEKAAVLPFLFQPDFYTVKGTSLFEYTVEKLADAGEYLLAARASQRGRLYDNAAAAIASSIQAALNTGDLQTAYDSLNSLSILYKQLRNFASDVSYYDRVENGIALIRKHVPLFCIQLCDAYIGSNMFAEAYALLEQFGDMADFSSQHEKVRMAEAVFNGVDYDSNEESSASKNTQLLASVQPLLDEGEYRRASQELARTGTAEALREAYRIRYRYLMDDRLAVDKHNPSKQITALAADGTVYTTLKTYATSNWINPNLFLEGKNFAAVACGPNFNVGLCWDGTVFCEGRNHIGQCDTSTWTDIVAIAAGENHTVGLRADGTVVATGDNSYGQLDVSSWSDVIAIDAFYSQTYGLRRDGSILIAGKNAGKTKFHLRPESRVIDFAAGELLMLLYEDGIVTNGAGDVINPLAGAVTLHASKASYVGINADGGALVKASDSRDQEEAAAFTNVAAIVAGDPFIVAVTHSGELLITTHRSGKSEPRAISHFGTLLTPASLDN